MGLRLDVCQNSGSNGLVSEVQVVQLGKNSKTAGMPHPKGGAYNKNLSLN